MLVNASKVYSSYIMVSNVTGELSDIKCKLMGTSSIARSYTFATADDSLIILSYIRDSSTPGDNLKKFDESVKTLRIAHPGKINESEIYKQFKKLEVSLLTQT